ncbi:TonB family C-terminal domain [Bordetella ansorpii]|uniref:TonB family C-terminal domain n=1 Tax=Bordetella ansorpii TaxID=288768 RepID=A0A146ANZ2_9BORD|nr:energy transducer TonB [Bordetella ansorpii]CZZ90900.1 TonB family C-terminal domain [Bordetella ansorpii]
MSSNKPETPDSREDSSSRLSALLDEGQQAKRSRSAGRFVWPVVGLVVVVGLGYFIWRWAGDMAGVQREAPKVAAIIPLPPPPPPPPPPEKPPEEPPPPEEVVEPKPIEEPKPIDQPKPDEAPPKPANDMANAMEMNTDAQAGSDAFNIGAGSGSGMAGSGGGGGFGNATYGQYMSYMLQKILREDERTRNLVYRGVAVNIWLDTAGQVTRVEVARSSGDAEVDEKLVATLRAVGRVDERPPASTPMPIRTSISSRRPS